LASSGVRAGDWATVSSFGMARLSAVTAITSRLRVSSVRSMSVTMPPNDPAEVTRTGRPSRLASRQL
jgi:hypothetical protein